jgi:hypothetical protein
MQDINGKLISQWNGDYWKLHNKVLNGKRTIQEAKHYMDKNYIENRDNLAYVHPSDHFLEMKFYNELCDAVKLGFGKDLNFENVFR